MLFASLAAAGSTATRYGGGAPGAARPPVPAGLTALESNAEDLVDIALAHDRHGVTAKANTLIATAEARPARPCAPAGASFLFDVVFPGAALMTLVERARARASSSTSIELAANAVSESVTELHRVADSVPVAVRHSSFLEPGGSTALARLGGQGPGRPAHCRAACRDLGARFGLAASAMAVLQCRSSLPASRRRDAAPRPGARQSRVSGARRSTAWTSLTSSRSLLALSRGAGPGRASFR